MTADNPWDSPTSAEEYDRYVRAGGIYRFLARDLVSRAGIADAARVLDLACGTGAATEACLATLPPDGEVIACDASEAMVTVAAAQIADPRVRFAVAPAEDLVEVCRGPIQRALCSAALWHFPSPRAVFAALAEVLDPAAGVFAFNLSAAMVRGAPAPVHPFQVTVTRLIEAAGGSQPRDPLVQLDLDQLDDALMGEGFAPAERATVTYRCPQRELMQLLEIPALLEPLAPDLPEARRDAVLGEARRRSDPEEVVEVPWIVLLTRLS